MLTRDKTPYRLLIIHTIYALPLVSCVHVWLRQVSHCLILYSSII